MFRRGGYGFQAVYSGIGYINQKVWVQDRVSFSRKLINWLPKSLGQGGFGEFSLVWGRKIQLNQLCYRLRVSGSQRHIPLKASSSVARGPLKAQHKAIFEAIDNQGIMDFIPNDNNISNMRKTWQTINALLIRRKSNFKAINKLKDPLSNNRIAHYPQYPSRIPNIMNTYFSSVGSNIAAKTPYAEHHYTDYLSKSKSPDSSSFLVLLLHMRNLKFYQTINHTACILVLYSFLNTLVTKYLLSLQIFSIRLSVQMTIPPTENV